MHRANALFLSILLVMVVTSTAVSPAIRRNRTAHVDTRIGSGGAGWGIANLNPGPQVPFGCMRLGPDTSIGLEPLRLEFDDMAGYYYNNEWIECFSHNHVVGAGEGDFQNFGVMVTRAFTDATVTNCGYRSLYEHDQEVALPGYYAVNLLSPSTYAELAVSGTHSGVHQYTCRPMDPAPAAPCVLVIDVCHGVTRNFLNLDIGDACLRAQVFNVTGDGKTFEVFANVLSSGGFSERAADKGVDVYFYAVISAGGVSLTPGMWENKTVLSSPQYSPTTSRSLGVAFTAAASTENVVFTVRAGISFVSLADAQNNLNSQQKTKSGAWMSFDDAVQQTVDAWESYLDTVQVSGGVASSDFHQAVFDTALLHTGYSPTTYSEVSGRYVGLDLKTHSVFNASQRYFSDLSIWDIYRTVAPLFAFIKPDVASDLTHSMMEMYRETGRLPVWPFANVETYCMVGQHSAVILTDYVLKGVGGIDAQSILDACVTGIGQQNIANLQRFGYVPQEASGFGASLTLDYAIDAGAVANLAEFLGKASIEATFRNYSQSYRNVWNVSQMYFCPRYSNGTGFCPFPLIPYPFADNYYTEGDGAQYRWYVPQDIPGLVGLFPSPSNFSQELNDFIALSYVWPFNTTFPNWAFIAGNEQDLQAPVMFNFAGNEYAHLTQSWLPQLLDTYYFPDPAGIPGNDDYGTMSAWVVWGYLGMYPIASTQQYALYAPRFDTIDIGLDAAGMAVSPWRDSVTPTAPRTTVLQIRAYDRPPTGTAYVANISVNGVRLGTPVVNHTQLVSSKGPTLIEFWLVSEPTVFGAQVPSRGGPSVFVPEKLRLTPAQEKLFAQLAQKTGEVKRRPKKQRQHS